MEWTQNTHDTMQAIDKECNRLFRKLDALRADHKEDTQEYLDTLLMLRDNTRARVSTMKSVGVNV